MAVRQRLHSFLLVTCLCSVQLGMLGCDQQGGTGSTLNSSVPLSNPSIDGALKQPSKVPVQRQSAPRKEVPAIGSENDATYNPVVYALVRHTRTACQRTGDSDVMDGVSSALIDLDIPQGRHRKLLSDFRTKILAYTVASRPLASDDVGGQVELLTDLANLLVPFDINGQTAVADGYSDLSGFISGVHLLNLLAVKVIVHRDAPADSKILDMPRYAEFAELNFMYLFLWDENDIGVMVRSAILGKLDMPSDSDDILLRAGVESVLEELRECGKLEKNEDMMSRVMAALLVAIETWELDPDTYRENGYVELADTVELCESLNALLQ